MVKTYRKCYFKLITFQSYTKRNANSSDFRRYANSGFQYGPKNVDQNTINKNVTIHIAVGKQCTNTGLSGVVNTTTERKSLKIKSLHLYLK